MKKKYSKYYYANFSLNEFFKFDLKNLEKNHVNALFVACKTHGLQ